jgi:hypothetical protein
MMGLLLGGIRLHGLEFTGNPNAVVSSNHESRAQRQSFDSDSNYCVAPPQIFAFEPAPAVFSRVVAAQDVFLAAHPDGWHFNRPPPSFQSFS